MPLFQPSVLKKFLSQLDSVSVLQAYEKYCLYFHNSTIQDNIRNSKEEQFQEGFLRELFVSILGYTLNPAPNFNLTTEYKNVKDSKKADGAILVNDKVSAVIELKGTNTTDLGKIEAQAFGYKNNQPECVYVITSNFEKLRFYIDNAIEHIEFNLFTLTEKEFQLLYLCLGYENLSQNSAKKIKDESLSQEDVITKKLYKDYSLFKRELHHNLVQLNPEFEPLELFKKSQKLLDRFLFLFFGEDRRLLPPNSVRLILNQWNQLKELDEYSPLYERFKKYFGYLNTGYKGVQHDVFAYNGGLFKPDAILDAITIDDNLLYSHTLKLSEYDFASEVDVNILGHIFENSLNELDEITNEVMGLNPLAKGQTKRKKDGVFYTPKYITKYIVENTVGQLCEEQKAVLGIVEEDYFTDKKRQKKTLQTLVEKLEEYRKWLLQLTICDPACGSGAFLNQALDFLIAEHQYIDELQAKLFGDGLVLSEMENSILENNLFGVDLNEESVEIAKLSLWLRTAQPNRKLNNLNSNIKCGNSLIDDPAIAGDKAFNWQRSFPTIFKEKNKKAFHITTAIHDSRTSQRMIDYKVREKRDMGTNPYPNVCYLEPEDEAIITQTISEIVLQHQLNLLQYNICKDHMHLVLVCEEEEVPVLMQQIKGKTARVHNSSKGINPLVQKENEKAVPLWTQKFGCKEITTPEQLYNTIEYVKHNRIKHELAAHPKATALVIENMLCTQEAAFTPEYKGGFDVIIGNPPYVQLQSMGSISDDLQKMKYATFEKTSDLYCLFHELGNIILKENGLLGFITSNKWLRANYGKSLRNYLLENTQPIELIDLGSGIFDSATVDSNILIFKKSKTSNNPFIGLDISKEKTFIDFNIYENFKVEINPIKDDIWTISNPAETKIKAKIEAKGTPLKEWNIKINYGIKTGFNDAFIIDEEKRNELIAKDNKSLELIVPILRGRDINRYNSDYQNLYLINVHNGYGGIPEIKIENYPTIKEHLDKFYTQLEKRGDKGKSPYNLRNCAYVDDFFNENLFYPDICQRLSFTKVNSMFSNNTGYYLKTSDSYLLSILNSNLINYYYKKISAQLGESGIRSFTIYIENIPIPKITDFEKQPFIEKADQMLSLNKELQEAVSKFQRTLQRKFFSTMGLNPLDTKDMGKKLQDWYMLTYAEFIKELAKKKVKLSLSEEAEWEEYFNQESKKALDLKAQIDATDKAIDTMVYALYGLSEEEIEIVENS
jgi:type I restriction-modification system DNA methylase subunit